MQKRISLYAGIGAILCLGMGFWAVTGVSSAPAVGYNSALRRYPYLTNAVSQNMTINWATDRSQTRGSVRYGRKGSESCTAHSATATKTAITVNGAPEYQWKAQLNLSTGTQYCYRIYLGTSPAIDLLGSDASPSFKTQLSSKATQSFSFAVFGDWGQVDSSGANPAQARLMSLIASSGARFAVTTGDNGYPSGSQTNFGDLVQTGSNVSAVFGPSFWKVPGASLPLFITQGNHGLSSTDTSHPALITWPEDRAASTSGGRYAREVYCCLDGTASAAYPSVWYAFNAGPARFYILDAAWSEANLGTASNPYQIDYDYHWAPGTAQYKWLKADLAAHPSGLKFAFLHYPLYSDNPTQPSDTFLQGSSRAEGLFKQYGVDIAFTGHAHIYQRNRASSTGIVNYVTGGGGATLGTLGTCSSVDSYGLGFTTKGKACGSASAPTSADQVYHFLKVTVNGTKVTVTPINSRGQSFDVMNYDFTPSVPTATPAGTGLSGPASFAAAASTRTPAVTSTVTATPTPICPPSLTSSPTVTNTATPVPASTRLLPATRMPPAAPTSTATVTPACPPTPTSSPTAVTAGTATPSPVGTLSQTPTLTAITPGSGTIMTFLSEADAQVVQSLPAANFGTLPTLQVSGGSGNAQISFIRFRVSGMRDTIQDVKLRVFCAANGTTKGPAAYLADSNWIESGAAGITWDHQPQLLSGRVDSQSTIGTGVWVEYDVASLVEGDGTYTFALISDSTDGVTFSSREGPAAPQLVVTLNP